MRSPYKGYPQSKWSDISKKLISKHPLKPDIIAKSVLTSWEILWNTTIGIGKTSFKLTEIELPATVIGYFLEKLIAKDLQNQFTGIWRGHQSKDDKDLVYIPNPDLSIEIKASGQIGTKIFGNRSYGQEIRDEGRARKDKSGFYVTINFYQQTLTLIRFGWIDFSDWKAQKAPTGQMAGLSEEAYKYKLIKICGSYMLNAPVLIIEGVGNKTAETFLKQGISSVGDLINYKGNDSSIIKYKEKAKEFLKDC